MDKVKGYDTCYEWYNGIVEVSIAKHTISNKAILQKKFQAVDATQRQTWSLTIISPPSPCIVSLISDVISRVCFVH